MESRQKLTVGGVAKRILRTSLLVYFVILIVLTFLQRQLLYHPRKADALRVAQFEDVTRLFPNSTDVELVCSDGITIRGWLLQKHARSDAQNSGRPLVLFFHGNAGNRAGRTGWYRLLESSGTDVLAVDYHGYGDSEGKMSEGSLQRACDATWSYAITELGYAPSEILIAGSSLGGAAAVYTAAEACASGDAPAGLAVVATFSSMTEVAGSLYPWLPVGAVLVDRYPSAERISGITSRIVVMHGDQDTLVRPQFGRKLFDAAPDTSSDGTPKKWISLDGTGHNDILSSAGHIIQPAIEELLQP